MSYQVMIVDDEPEIAEGIAFLIQRFCPECQVAEVAYDGLEGYEKAISLRPDIILTDIRMPECDGLEMIRRLQAGGLSTKYVVLSGYAEFEYAKTAITLGVEDFITKPVEEDELCAVLQKSCRSLQREQENHEKLQHMKSTMKDYVLKDFLERSGKYTETIKDYLEQYDFPVSGRQYVCLVTDLYETPERERRQEFLRLVKEKELASLGFLQACFAVEYSQEQIVLTGALKREMEPRSLHYAAEKLKNQLTQLLDTTVNIGIGMPYRNVEDIPKSFEEARCALNYKIMKGSDCVISYTQICDIEDSASPILPEDIKRLEECIDRMDDEGCRAAIEEIFRKISDKNTLSLEELQMLSLNLILSGIRKIPFVQFQLNQYLGKNIFSLESISKFRTIEQLKNWIINTLRSMNELMLKDNLSEKKDVIQEAKEYITKNFNREIGLNEISEKFFINPYYFSQLFKKKTGETYQNYLIGLRVERAKKLLTETDLKIYEVCEKVGYSDANHFNKVFERFVGMRPSEYKKQRR